jgi:hypothetical protein
MRVCFVLAAAFALAGSGFLAPAANADPFNKTGNILISDQFNNRVIEVDPHNKKIVYSFGSNKPKLCNPGPGAIIAPNDVERLANGLTLMAGTGTSSCPDNRVIVVDPDGNIVFQYGQAGVAGSGPNELNTPVFALQTPDGNYLITDQGNNRIIEVDPNGNMLFSYGPSSGPGALNSPNSAELLSDGHILIADENNNRVIEIDQNGNIVFETSAALGLNTVAFASRLSNGDTLITDSGNNRIVEIDSNQNVVFQYATNQQKKSNANPNPTNAVRLDDGNTLIADQFNDRVFIIDPNSRIVFQYGKLNTPGNKANRLNAPYNAMVIGDYTGLTPPADPGRGY